MNPKHWVQCGPLGPRNGDANFLPFAEYSVLPQCQAPLDSADKWLTISSFNDLWSLPCFLEESKSFDISCRRRSGDAIVFFRTGQWWRDWLGTTLIIFFLDRSLADTALDETVYLWFHGKDSKEFILSGLLEEIDCGRASAELAISDVLLEDFCRFRSWHVNEHHNVVALVVVATGML